MKKILTVAIIAVLVTLGIFGGEGIAKGRGELHTSGNLFNPRAEQRMYGVTVDPKESYRIQGIEIKETIDSLKSVMR